MGTSMAGTLPSRPPGPHGTATAKTRRATLRDALPDRSCPRPASGGGAPPHPLLTRPRCSSLLRPPLLPPPRRPGGVVAPPHPPLAPPGCSSLLRPPLVLLARWGIAPVAKV